MRAQYPFNILMLHIGALETVTVMPNLSRVGSVRATFDTQPTDTCGKGCRACVPSGDFPVSASESPELFWDWPMSFKLDTAFCIKTWNSS